MKNLIAIFLLTFCTLSFAQEELNPLSANPSLYIDSPTQLRSGGGIDSTFTYTFGSLDITDVWDDFSVNKFVNYPPNYTDGNVSSQWYFCLMNSVNTVPEPTNVIYCDETKARHDTISIVSGIPTTFTTNFTPHSIWVNDLDNFPVTGQTYDLYDECYVIIDSIIDGVPNTTQDTIWYTTDPTYVQDSANVFSAFMSDPNNIWVDNSACHNYRFAVDPWSLGVATFDGVDSTGLPYDFGNENAYGDADALTSKAINLTGHTNVFLTFLYQAQGYGNMPEEADSLVVDFWLVDSLEWYNIWYPPVFPAANQWDTAHIAIPPNFLENGFRFRIRNKASTSGALDHWHLDYVEMVENPILPWEPYKDLAISMPLVSLLKDYTAAPWDHFRNLASPIDKMIDTAYLQVYNSDNTPTNVGSTSMFLNVNYDGINQLNYQLPNPGLIPPWTSNWELGTNYFPFFVSSNYTFDAPGNDSIALFDVTINADADVAASNAHEVNDTIKFQQAFKNFYAYDDGSAEVGYGITGSNSQLAYGFEAYEADTLAGVLMHFVPTVTDVSDYIMLLTIWNDNDGVPGDILYQDDYFTPHYPEYGASKNEFRYYTFVNTDYPSEIVVPEKFYVGWEQIESQTLNIGMDRNTNSGSNIKFNVGGEWITSSQEGSLMIRPVFSTAINHTLNIDEENISENISMYPNPTTEVVSFSGLRGDFEVSVYDMSGRLVALDNNMRSIDVSNLQTGVYLVNVNDQNGNSIFSEKLIKQ